jgi:hypothetical protein
MKVTVEFEDGDFDPIHDIIFDLTGKKLTHEELSNVWKDLPENLKEDSIHWGINDSVVRDNIYTHLENNYK